MRPGARRSRGFHLEINSLEDFLLFCTILRSDDDADPAKLQALVARLKTANDIEAQTVAANTPARNRATAQKANTRS